MASATAHAQVTNYQTDVHLIIQGNEVDNGLRHTVNAGDSILSTDAYSPRAVRITEDITVGVLGDGYDLPEGATLFGRYEDSVWTYCGSFAMNTESAAASAIALGVLSAGFTLLLEPFADRENTICLHDADQDGIFDTGWGDASPNYGSKRVVYLLAEKSISAQAPYERIDPLEGPAIPIDVTWRSSRNEILRMQIRMDDQEITEVQFPVPSATGEPVRVEINEVVLLVHGFDRELETLDVEIVEGFSARYTRVPATLRVTTSYYYY